MTTWLAHEVYMANEIQTNNFHLSCNSGDVITQKIGKATAIFECTIIWHIGSVVSAKLMWKQSWQF